MKGVAAARREDLDEIGRAALQTAVLEPREGGRWYERAVEGWERVRDTVGSTGGWNTLLDLFKARAEAA